MGVVSRSTALGCYLASCLLVDAQAQRFAISQAHVQLPAMTCFVDIVDTDEQVPSSLNASNFSAMLGTQSVSVTGVQPFEKSGEGVAYAFLVDVSGSISPRDFTLMQAAISKWIESLKSKDRAAIYTFGEQYSVVMDFTADKQQLTSAVSSLAPKDAHTHFYEAVRRSMDIERRTDSDLPSRRVIFMMSDGKDEGSAITSGDVVHDLRISHIPLYAIGYSRLRQSQRQQYLDVLRRFADLSGGVYQESTPGNLNQVYASMQQAILRVFILSLTCPQCAADGRSYPLQVTLNRDARSLISSMDVFALGVPQRSQDRGAARNMNVNLNVKVAWWMVLPPWLWILIAIAIAGILALIVLSFKRKKSPSAVGVAPSLVKPSFQSTNTATTPRIPEVSTRGVPLQISIVVGRDQGRIYKLDLMKTLVIGRAQECGLVLNDPKVSKRHAEIQLARNVLVIYDLSSQNSTYVNGVPIQGRHKLDDEDTIAVGGTELRLRFNKDELLGR